MYGSSTNLLWCNTLPVTRHYLFIESLYYANHYPTLVSQITAVSLQCNSNASSVHQESSITVNKKKKHFLVPTALSFIYFRLFLMIKMVINLCFLNKDYQNYWFLQKVSQVLFSPFESCVCSLCCLQIDYWMYTYVYCYSLISTQTLPNHSLYSNPTQWGGGRVPLPLTCRENFFFPHL